MGRSLILISLLTITECSVIGQYYYVSQTLTWTAAQAYCREHYDDMAFVHDKEDEIALEKSGAVDTISGFFGLHRDIDNITGWKWSGGGYITYTYWHAGQPNNVGGEENCGFITSKGWMDEDEHIKLPFYCMSLPIVEEVGKSWEDAMEHCGESHRNLISLRSDTELLLLLKLMTEQGHDRIWIGLRFLAGGWLWVNGDPLGFQAWSEEEKDLQCPPLGRCGAMTAEGHWETLDCGEKLRFMCN